MDVYERCCLAAGVGVLAYGLIRVSGLGGQVYGFRASERLGLREQGALNPTLNLKPQHLKP